MVICTICDRYNANIYTYVCVLHNMFNIIFLAVYNLRYSHQGLNYLDLHTNLKFSTPIADVSVELDNIYAQY